MGDFEYGFQSLANIGFGVGGGATTCPAGGAGAPGTLLRALPDPLAATAAQLLQAALSIGTYPGNGIGTTNLTEALWRLWSCRAAAKVDNDIWSPLQGSWVTTKLVAHFDASDRANLSYLFGGTATALIATQIGVTNFMSLERYQAAVAPPALAWRAAFANLRPDFLSQLAGSFQAWESKGRAGANYGAVGGAVNADLRKAFRQAYAIQTVNGAVPSASVAVMAHAYAGMGHGYAWRLSVVDPGVDELTRLTGEQQDAVYREYYRPWLTLIQLLRGGAALVSAGGASFTVVPVPNGAVSVGLDARIIEIFNAGNRESGALSAALDKVLAGGYKNDGASRFVNPNGFYLAEATIAPGQD